MSNLSSSQRKWLSIKSCGFSFSSSITFVASSLMFWTFLSQISSTSFQVSSLTICVYSKTKEKWKSTNQLYDKLWHLNIKQGFDLYPHRARCPKGRKSNVAWCKCNPSRKTDPMDSPSSSINQCSIFINWSDRWLNKTRKQIESQKIIIYSINQEDWY